MRRAGRKHVSSRESNSPSPTNSPPRSRAMLRESMSSAASAVDEPIAEVLVSSAGTFTAAVAVESHDRSQRNRQLAIAIRQRIESRLPGRVRELSVRILGRTVVLEGQCATYYTKQLAQHAALGILEDEQLENAIAVGVTR
jgi:hypothetical protein